MSSAVSSVSRSMRISSGPRSRKEKPRSRRSSCMLDTPRSASTPSAGGSLRSAKTSPICEKLACTKVTLSPNSASLVRAISSAAASRSRPTNCPPAPSRRTISIACPPSPTVASTYSPPGFIASQWIVSSTSTGVCFASKLDACVGQCLSVFVRHLVLVHVVHEPIVVPNFQIRPLTQHVHFTLDLRGFPKHGRDQDSALSVHLHRLTVIVGAGQELFLGLVIGRDLRQFLFDLSPGLHRVNPRANSVFTGDVEAIAMFFELLQKGRRNLETALLVDCCRCVST